MKWQNSREWIVKYIIVFVISIPSISLISAQEFVLGEEQLLGGIFSPDGNLLAVRTVSAKVLVFDTDSLRLIKTLSAQGRGLYKLAFSPDSRYLAWSEETLGANVGVWDLSTSKQVAYFQLNAWHIDALVFVPGGELLAAQAGDYVGIGTPDPGVVHFWRVGTWEKHGTWRPPGNGTVSSLAFTHDGERFVASSTRGPVGEWVNEEFTVDVQTFKTVDSRQGQGRTFAFSLDGRFSVAPVGWDNRALLIRDPENHAQIALLSDPVVGYLLFRSISPDSKWLATWYWQQEEVVIWDTQTWEIKHRLPLPSGQSIAHGFVRDTYWYADLASTGELRIWDLIAQDGWVGVLPLPGMKITPWGYIRMIR
jgi:WD40 repeat protein